MIKQLLVGVDRCGHSLSAARYACALAKQHNARILGIAVVDTEGIEESYHTPRPLGAGSADADLYKKNLDQARKNAEAALAGFKKICEEQKVDFKAELKEGSPKKEFLKAASLNDLIVLGKKTQMEFGTSEDASCNTWWEVLTLTERPLILVPENHREVKSVMIALDFHRLADRILFNYVHLNPYPGARVFLVHATESGKEEKAVKREYIDYLQSHGISAEPKLLYGEHPGQALLNYANTENIDLAVIGVHTMSKVLAALLGGTARFLIENLEIPVYAQT